MTVIVSDKAGLVVPPSVRRRAGLKAGDRVEFRVSGGVINIVPKTPSPAVRPKDELTLTQRKAIDRELAKGLADVKMGRVQGPFATYDGFIASLHADASKPSVRRAKSPVR